MRDLAEIGADINSQENLATAHPLFIVQQKRRIYGIDPDHSHDGYILVSYGEEVGEDELEENELTLEDCDKVYYIDIWQFVTACFTRVGCEQYLQANGHNLKDPRIYIESAHRNVEYQTVRDFLKSLPNES